MAPALPQVRGAIFGELMGSGNRLVAVDIGGAGDLQPHWMKLRPICDFVVFEAE